MYAQYKYTAEKIDIFYYIAEVEVTLPHHRRYSHI